MHSSTSLLQPWDWAYNQVQMNPKTNIMFYSVAFKKIGSLWSMLQNTHKESFDLYII